MATLPATPDRPNETPLQRRLLELAVVLSDARSLNGREREVFASIGAHMDVLRVEVAMDQRGRYPRTARLHLAPARFQDIALRGNGVQHRDVVTAQGGMAQMAPDRVARCSPASSRNSQQTSPSCWVPP